jgi:hypothetical protein
MLFPDYTTGRHWTISVGDEFSILTNAKASEVSMNDPTANDWKEAIVIG